MQELKPLRLADYAAHVSELAKNYPDAVVIYASDEEGNSFHKSYFAPAMGCWQEGWQEFLTQGDIQDRKETGDDGTYELNACCIN